MSIQNRRDDYKLVLSDEVANASLILCGIVSGYRMEVEFESCCKRRDDSNKQRQKAHYSIHHWRLCTPESCGTTCGVDTDSQGGSACPVVRTGVLS